MILPSPVRLQTILVLMIKLVVASLLALVPYAEALPQSQDDPIVMTVAGVPVPRSEFEYSYNKKP